MTRLNRRAALAGLAAALAGCKFYSDPPPVVIGGAPVSAQASVMAALRASSEHRRFAEALEASDLAEVLEGIGPFTIFAPTDAAFGMLRPKAAAAMLAENPAALKLTMLNHIVPARLTTEDLRDALPQLSGRTKVFARNDEVISIVHRQDGLRLYDMRDRVAKLVQADAIAGNGIIHVIDGVLLPRDAVLTQSP